MTVDEATAEAIERFERWLNWKVRDTHVEVAMIFLGTRMHDSYLLTVNRDILRRQFEGFLTTRFN